MHAKTLPSSTTRTTARASHAAARSPVPRPTLGVVNRSARSAFLESRNVRRGSTTSFVVRSSTEAETQSTGSSEKELPKSFEVALNLDELPKGSRATLDTGNNKRILFFWYRNQIYGIENRSPAEGAFSDGFKDSRFTQDGCIECQATKSTFRFTDGSGGAVEWYPDNPVLRALTPKDTCRPLECFPVEVRGDTVYVDPFNSNISTMDEYDIATPVTKGGSATSAENNNVFGIEPPMYYEDGTEVIDSPTIATKVEPATLLLITVAVAIVAVAGTATCLFYENIIALALFWIVGFGSVAYSVKDSFLGDDQQ